MQIETVIKVTYYYAQELKAKYNKQNNANCYPIMNKSFIMNALIIVLLIIVGLILLKFLTQLVILIVIIGGAYLLYRLYLKNKRKL